MLKLNSDDLVVCWPAGDVHAAGNCVQVAPALEVAVKPRGAAAGLTLEARVEGSVRRKRRGRENNRTWQKVNCTPFTDTDTALHDSTIVSAAAKNSGLGLIYCGLRRL